MRFYQAGLQWGSAHSQALESYALNRHDFRGYMLRLIEHIVQDESPDSLFPSIRLYNRYLRNPEEAREHFIGGAWDSLHGQAGVNA